MATTTGAVWRWCSAAVVRRGAAHVGAPVSWRSLIVSRGPIVAAVTPGGPLYLGYGIAEGGRDHFYLVLGQRL